MEIRTIRTIYYSATGTTERVVATIGSALSEALKVPLEEQRAFTRPAEREAEAVYSAGDLVVVGAPTYAGRLPNKIMPDLREKLRGNGALAVPVVLFGNRAYDNALAELSTLLEENGFHTVAAGAFVGQHAFSEQLAYGRPGWSDQFEMKTFAKQIADKVKRLTDIPEKIVVPGVADAPYYVPKGTDGEPVNFLKAKPKTDLRRCNSCGACARLCPMGAIDPKNVSQVPGICIKCQRCVRKCTKGAKYFDDLAFLSHVAMLERTFDSPAENETFL